MMTQTRKHGPPATPRLAARRGGALDELLDPVLFKALADPTRALLIACIAKCARGCSVGEVAQCCSVDFSGVSRHLALLGRSGLLEAKKEGRTVFYRVRYAELCRLFRALAHALESCCPYKGGGCDAGCC